MTTNKEANFDARLTTTQTVTDWFGRPVTLRYAGRCLGCNSPVYDGADDPRGVTGPKHFNDGFEADGKKYPACFTCMNDNLLYDRVRHKVGLRVMSIDKDRETLRKLAEEYGLAFILTELSAYYAEKNNKARGDLTLYTTEKKRRMHESAFDSGLLRRAADDVYDRR